MASLKCQAAISINTIGNDEKSKEYEVNIQIKRNVKL